MGDALTKDLDDVHAGLLWWGLGRSLRPPRAPRAVDRYWRLRVSRPGERGIAFRERDHQRLLLRLEAIVGSNVSFRDLQRLAAGDCSLFNDLPLSARQSVLPLLEPSTETFATLESMVGSTLDYVPIWFLDQARMSAASVVRLIDLDRRAIGTGILVSNRLLLTNNHVTPSALAAYSQLAQFDYEIDIDGAERPTTEFRLDPEAMYFTSPIDQLDFTIVGLGPRLGGTASPDDFGHAAMSASLDKHAVGDFVTLIQHPAGDYKQIALRDNRVIGRGRGGVTIHYTADTLGGSSGSPVYNDQFELVALHHSGRPRNDTVLEDGQPVPVASNEGIRISAIVRRLRDVADTLSRTRRDLLLAALDSRGRVPASPFRSLMPTAITLGSSEAVTAPASDAGADARELPGNTTPTSGDRWTRLVLPVNFTFAATGVDPAREPEQSMPNVSAAKVTEGRTIGGGASKRASVASRVTVAPSPADYSERRGYLMRFVGPNVPLPKLSPAAWAAAAVPVNPSGTDGVELRYTHFSLVQSAVRRMPCFIAVNIEGEGSQGGGPGTDDVGDDYLWHPDPRLRPSDQLDPGLFATAPPPLALVPGHLMRPVLPAWGSPIIASTACRDAYSLTNCCLRDIGFEQDAQLWLDLESHLLATARALGQRISMFTGPLLLDGNRTGSHAAVPAGFWKVVIHFDVTEGLRAGGFIADQTGPLDSGDGTVSAGVRQLQVPIAQVEHRTGLSFGDLGIYDSALGRDPALLATPADVVW